MIVLRTNVGSKANMLVALSTVYKGQTEISLIYKRFHILTKVNAY